MDFKCFTSLQQELCNGPTVTRVVTINLKQDVSADFNFDKYKHVFETCTEGVMDTDYDLLNPFARPDFWCDVSSYPLGLTKIADDCIKAHTMKGIS